MSNSSLQFVFSCPLSTGMHARPASHLAEVASQFAAESTITNLRNGLSSNAKSVLGIISADIRHGDRCAISVHGADEKAAHTALRHFVEDALPRCDVPLTEIPEAKHKTALPRSLQATKTAGIFGTVVSRGIAQGKVVVLRRMSLPKGSKSTESTNPQRELDRIKEAVSAVRQRISEKLKYSITPTGTAVLQADLAMAGDVFLVEKLNERVLLGKSAAQAVVETGEFFIDLLGHSENEYIRQRSVDIEEICLQLLEEVNGDQSHASVVELHEPSVLVAESLAPQQLLELDRRWLKAIVLEHSATTSHASILARSLGIPALAGVRNARTLLASGREVVVDADRGFVIPQLSSGVRRFYEREHRTIEKRKEAWSGQAEKMASTVDGTSIEVAANSSSGEEQTLAFANGADGIGLLRTEMIFLGRDEPPSEEEQFAIYSETARLANVKPVIIRTFDIGGDKKVPYLNLPHEENPFLGYRGARIYAEYRDLLQSQLRAILRASQVGNLQIMAPMISSLDEMVQFKNEIALAQRHLLTEGVEFRPVKIGMMIEVPSVAYALEQFCDEVDFFSIGTNDLCQYFFAADRGNPKVSSHYSVRHPSFLRLLEQIVDQIREAGKWVGMCGEMAADIKNLPLLLALGLDEISVPAAEVHDCKQAIARLHITDCIKTLDQALTCSRAEEVDELLNGESFQIQTQSLLSNELVLQESSSENKEEVIQEMVDALYICGRTDDRLALEEAVWAREAMGSTSFGYGFAIPHCKTDAVTANSICVLQLKQPINWDSAPVNMVVLLALRDSDVANTHMQVFSSLARKLMNDDFRHHLLNVKTPNEVTSYLADQLGISLEDAGENSVHAEPPAQSHS